MSQLAWEFYNITSQLFPKVIWNHPDNCEKKGIHLNLQDYDIIFNKGRVFLGNQIQTLYVKNTGMWPTLSKSGDPVHYSNGGLPQVNAIAS